MTFVRDLGRDHAAHPSCHSYSVPIARAIESVHFPHGAASVISIALQFPSPERAQLAHRRVNEVVFTQCRKKKKKKKTSRRVTCRDGAAGYSDNISSLRFCWRINRQLPTQQPGCFQVRLAFCSADAFTFSRPRKRRIRPATYYIVCNLLHSLQVDQLQHISDIWHRTRKRPPLSMPLSRQ